MHPASSDERRSRVLFLVNALFVAVVSLPLIFAYPAVFARLGIASLENGFFVQLAGAWLFVEAIASALVWRGTRVNTDTIWVIIAMKMVVVLALFTATLPSPAFLVGAAIDAALSIAFVVYLRQHADV